MKQEEPNPSGLCQCGCGQRTSIARWTQKGVKRGQSLRYVRNHHRRGIAHPNPPQRKSNRYRVENRGYETPCWIWQLTVLSNGYGQDWDGQRKVPAHRLSYERHRGPIPEGLTLDHLCRVPLCVNPDHLEPVTPAENTRRGLSTKLTQKSADQIRALVEAGWQQRDVANAYGVSPPLVCLLMKGKVWA